MRHVTRMSRNSRRKKKLRRKLQNQSRKIYLKNWSRKQQNALQLRKQQMPLQSLMRYGITKHRIIIWRAMAQCRHSLHQRKRIFSAVNSTGSYKVRIYQQRIYRKQKQFQEQRRFLEKKMISPTLTHRQSGSVWKKQALWTGSL